jgi:tRNA(adenine34) deaminase
MTAEGARTITDPRWMTAALTEARTAATFGDVPVGAVIVRDGEVIARAANRTVRDQDPTAHAELLAIRAASAALGRWRLDDCTLYVTLEPCAMCAGAIVLARVARVVLGAWDSKAGMAGSVGDLLRHPRLNHRPEVAGGVLEPECAALLRDFFTERRRAGFVDTPPAAG